ncbi:hypothetical protein EIT96_14250 [Salmonella enterica subsp. enterica serovar Colindale]|nr:hypothetical protein [Salmonella enterica subsp. enterica]
MIFRFFMKRIILISLLMLISFSSFSAETKSSKNDERCRFIASKIGGVCDNGWGYINHADEMRGGELDKAYLEERDHKGLLELFSDKDERYAVDLNIYDAVSCGKEPAGLCVGRVKFDNSSVHDFNFVFANNKDGNSSYIRIPSLAFAAALQKSRKMVIELSTVKASKSQFVFLIPKPLKWKVVSDENKKEFNTTIGSVDFEANSNYKNVTKVKELKLLSDKSIRGSGVLFSEKGSPTHLIFVTYNEGCTKLENLIKKNKGYEGKIDKKGMLSWEGIYNGDFFPNDLSKIRLAKDGGSCIMTFFYMPNVYTSHADSEVYFSTK